MSLFEQNEPTKEIKKKESPKQIISKKYKLSPELIKIIEKGGATIEEEINRPFWELPPIIYPYDHFIPAFMMCLGHKGGGKSTIGLSVSGNILGITFEKRGNITRAWNKAFKHHPRMQLYGVGEYIDRGDLKKYQRTASNVYLRVCDLLNRAIKLKKKFDWILIDGLQVAQITTTQRMKILNQVEAMDNLPTKKLTKWGERSLYLENMVIDLSQKACTKGVFITSQNVEHKAMFLTKEQIADGMKEEDIPVIQPKWKDKVKDDIDTVIFVQKKIRDLGIGRSTISYEAIVDTNKLGGGTGSHDITLDRNPQATKKLIEKLLTSDLGYVIEEPIYE